MKSLSFKIASLLVAAGLAGSAYAAPIAVANGDFEDRTGTEYADAADWTTPAGFGGGYVTTEINPTIFSADGSGNAPGTYLFMQGPNASTSSDLGAAAAGMTYTASVLVGNPFAAYAQHPDTYTLELLIGGAVVATNTTDGTAIANDTWQALSVSYNSTGADVGSQLSIRVSETGTGQQSFYDNVTLDESPVPEPGSLALLGLGGLALLRRRRA